MTDSEQGFDKRCPREVDIVAFLQDELTRGPKQTFEKHLATCSSCAQEIEQYRKLIGRLLTPLSAMPTRDLTPDILTRIPSTFRFRVIVRSPAFLRAAALFLCFVAAAALVCVLRPHPKTVAAGAKYDQRIDSFAHRLWGDRDSRPGGRRSTMCSSATSRVGGLYCFE